MKTPQKLAALAIISYIVLDFWRTRYDALVRYAAGESLFEKTHTKKRK